MKANLGTERGMVLLIALAVMVMLVAVILMAVNSATTDLDLTFNEVDADKAFYVAQTGIAVSEAQLNDDPDWRSGYAVVPYGEGAYTVVVLDSSSNPVLDDTVVVRSVGTVHNSNRIVEVLLLQALAHPLYYHAIYAGNSTEYDPSLPPDSQNWTSTMDFGGTGLSRDIINGDVFFNGDVTSSGDAEMNGDVTSGGTYSGNTPTGSTTNGADYLEPPDLRAMNYETTSDYYVGSSTPFNASGYVSSADPRHIFVKDFRTDLSSTFGNTFDNTNYFLGDPYEGTGLSRISVSTTGNHKTYFVDGNLWIEPHGTTSQLINSPPEGTQIHIVVKGNIYFSDDFLYNNEDYDGVAFTAMTDGESYNDDNNNNKYDPGEPILHDDGDGVYEGPAEGSGNIRFGDPNGGPLGDISGFLYAENNFEDYVLDGPDGTPQEFSVNGSLSAGNHLNIRRDFGGGHAEMRVNYDDRIERGILDLPGLPGRNSPTSSGWRRVAWREL